MADSFTMAERTMMPVRYFRQAYLHFGTTPAQKHAILTNTGISEDMLANPDGMIPVSAQIEQIKNLNILAGEGFPLEAKPVWRPASQGALDIVFRSAPTIGEGLHHLARFASVRVPQIDITITGADAGETITLAPTIALPDECWRPIAEMVLLSLQAMLESVVDDSADKISTQGIRYFWSWVMPSYIAALEKAFYGTHMFTAATCGAFIPASITRRTSPYADQLLMATTLSQLQLAEQKNLSEYTLADEVRAMLKAHAPQSLQAEVVASQLNLSLRSFVRRLSADHTSFRALQDADLKQRAEALIINTSLTREQIADELGYNDPSSLSRACKRWFGMSIRDYRCHTSP